MITKQLHILLADDDPDDCDLFKLAMRKSAASINISMVHDGEHLMQVLINEEGNLPDFLFLDINMPRKNGLQCLAEIKKHEKLRELPVIILSTSLEYDKINDLFLNGADVYVRKPGNFEQLVQVIHLAIPMAAENTLTTDKLKYVLNA